MNRMYVLKCLMMNKIYIKIWKNITESDRENIEKIIKKRNDERDMVTDVSVDITFLHFC